MTPTERAKLERREAKGGSLAAQTQLGLWHLTGAEGLERNHVRAVALFRRAADLGHACAQASLAACYVKGWGVEQSDAQALAWMRKQADQCHAHTQYAVGKAYARGEGTEKDLPLGKRYLELSAAQGYGDAVALLKDLRETER